jgi:hypothetical protein
MPLRGTRGGRRPVRVACPAPPGRSVPGVRPVVGLSRSGTGRRAMPRMRPVRCCGPVLDVTGMGGLTRGGPGCRRMIRVRVAGRPAGGARRMSRVRLVAGGWRAVPGMVRRPRSTGRGHPVTRMRIPRCGRGAVPSVGVRGALLLPVSVRRSAMAGVRIDGIREEACCRVGRHGRFRRRVRPIRRTARREHEAHQQCGGDRKSAHRTCLRESGARQTRTPCRARRQCWCGCPVPETAAACRAR